MATTKLRPVRLAAQIGGKPEPGFELCLPRQRSPHRQVVGHVGDVVDAQDVGAGIDPVTHRGERPGEPRARGRAR